MSKELEKAAEEYSINGDYQFMSTFQQMAQKAFIAGANWQARNTIITDNSLVIDNLEKEIERLNFLLMKDKMNKHELSKEMPKEVIDIFKRAGIDCYDFDYYAFPEIFGSTSGPHGGIGGDAMSKFTVEAYVYQDIATVYVCSGKYKFRKGKYAARWH